jgi:hypothetical protein
MDSGRYEVHGRMCGRINLSNRNRSTSYVLMFKVLLTINIHFFYFVYFTEVNKQHGGHKDNTHILTHGH